jgi:hypothetical protein
MSNGLPNQSGTGSGTSTYSTTSSTIQTYIVPSVITQSDQIAMYFANDLEAFVKHTHLDLAREFQIPYEYSQDTMDIINMLYADISHMLRDRLITGIHLILSDNEMDVGSNAYVVRYHVCYTITNPNALLSSSSASAEVKGDLVMPPPRVWQGARFALLIDWSPESRGKRHMVRRPDYCFDWMPREERFDATNVIRYSHGALVADTANVIRYEAAPPEYQKRIP